jgi:hypothetical protein
VVVVPPMGCDSNQGHHDADFVCVSVRVGPGNPAPRWISGFRPNGVRETVAFSSPIPAPAKRPKTSHPKAANPAFIACSAMARPGLEPGTPTIFSRAVLPPKFCLFAGSLPWFKPPRSCPVFAGLCVRFPGVTADGGTRRPFRRDGVGGLVKPPDAPDATMAPAAVAGPSGRPGPRKSADAILRRRAACVGLSACFPRQAVVVAEAEHTPALDETRSPALARSSRPPSVWSERARLPARERPEPSTKR